MRETNFSHQRKKPFWTSQMKTHSTPTKNEGMEKKNAKKFFCFVMQDKLEIARGKNWLMFCWVYGILILLPPTTDIFFKKGKRFPPQIFGLGGGGGGGDWQVPPRVFFFCHLERVPPPPPLKKSGATLFFGSANLLKTNI